MNRLRRERILVMGMLGGDKFAYRKLWLHTIHVATTGNDTTGNGSLATPYLTLTKAMTVAVAGDGILVADGTYAENTAAVGYWNINNKGYATWVVIEPEKGILGDVTITGSSGYYNLAIQGTTTYLHFKYLKFSYVGTRYGVYINGAVSNVKFTNCQTLAVDGAYSGWAIQGSGNIVNNISLINCTVNQPTSAATFVGVDIDGHITNFTNISFDNCNVSGVYRAYDISACGSLSITNGTATAGTGGGAVGISLTNAGDVTVSGVSITRTGGYAVACSSAGNVATFTNCTLVGGVGFGAGNVTFTGCSITGVGIQSSLTEAAATPSFINCTVTGTTVAFQSNGITGIVIIGGTYTTTENGTSLVFGVDGETGKTTTAIVTGITVVHPTNKTGHAVLFGAGCLNCVADNITIDACFDYALVVKENTGTEVKNCNITSGNTTALCFKAAISANAHNNTLKAMINGTCGFWLTGGDTGNKNSNWQLQNNVINTAATGKALKIETSAVADAGGGVCDYNQYQNNSGLGVVRNDPNVQSLAELQAAWADYDVTTNDAHSTVV